MRNCSQCKGVKLEHLETYAGQPSMGFCNCQPTRWEERFDAKALEFGLDGEQMDELRDFFRKEKRNY